MSYIDDIFKGIDDAIDGAINSNNYSRLNSEIKAKMAGFSNAAEQMGRINQFTQGLNFDQPVRRADQAPRRQSQETAADAGRQYQAGWQRPFDYGMGATPFRQHKPRILAPRLKAVFGIIFGIISILFTIACLVSIVVVPGAAILMIVSAIISVLFIIMARSGLKEKKLAKLFGRYAKAVGRAEYIAISTLADRVGETPAITLDNLKNMVLADYLPQARFDDRETTLILTERAYSQYMRTEKANRAAREEKAQQARAEHEMASEEQTDVDEGVQKILDAGREYISKVRRANDLIPDKEMSDKLDRTEMILTKIFEQVRKHPERAGDMQKFMNYYLPMVEKLLKAYIDVDKQPVSGENIASTRKEIEEVMDTINTAFETFLDDMFEDLSWDVSSDISVMKTMMQQDGLTDDGLKKTASKTDEKGDTESGPTLHFGDDN